MAFFDNTEDADLNNDYPSTKVANDPARQADATRLEKEIDILREQINQEGLAVAKTITDYQVWKSTAAKASAATEASCNSPTACSFPPAPIPPIRPTL